MKKNHGAIIALAALVLVAAVFVGVYFATRNTPPPTNEGNNGEPGSADIFDKDIIGEGSKLLTIQVVHGNGETKEFRIRTDAEYLGDALVEYEELGVVGENGPYGLYIKEVDGEEASDADHTFWSVSLNGESLMVGADGQFIADGEHYELVLTKW